MKDLPEEDEATLRANAARLKTAMEELKDNVHFKLFLTEVEKQIKQRSVAVFGFPDGGLDTVVKNIYTSGEVAGLRITLEFADILIEFAKQTLDVSDFREEAKAAEQENG